MTQSCGSTECLMYGCADPDHCEIEQERRALPPVRGKSPIQTIQEELERIERLREFGGGSD